MRFRFLIRTALIAVVPVYVYSASIRPAIGDTSLATADLQVNFSASASSFGLQVVDRTNNSVLLTQSSLTFGSSQVTGVNSISHLSNGLVFNLKLASGGSATATYTAVNDDRIQVALSSTAASVTQSFADQGDRYYGTWMNTYANSATGLPVNLDNRGIANGKYYGSFQTEGGTEAEGTRAPYYFTNKNVGIYAETTAQGSYDFTSKASFTFDSQALTYDILRANSPKGVLQSVQSIAGAHLRHRFGRWIRFGGATMRTSFREARRMRRICC